MLFQEELEEILTHCEGMEQVFKSVIKMYFECMYLWKTTGGTVPERVPQELARSQAK